MGFIPYSDNGITMLLIIVPMVLAMVAQAGLQKNYAKYSKLPNSKGITGAQAARFILDRNGLTNVTIGKGQGVLSDYFDPTKGHINLSPDVYDGHSVASVAVAAHEVGHAIQHQQKYAFIGLRNKILPFAQIGSSMSWIVIFLGIIMSSPNLLWIGVILLIAILLFQLFTLPLEFDASKRAVVQLENNGLLASTEVAPAKKVLKSAAMTYVVAVIAALAQVLRFVIIAQNNRD